MSITHKPTVNVIWFGIPYISVNFCFRNKKKVLILLIHCIMKGKWIVSTHQWFHSWGNVCQMFRRYKWEAFRKSPRSPVKENVCWQDRSPSSRLTSSLREADQAVKPPRKYNNPNVLKLLYSSFISNPSRCMKYSLILLADNGRQK